MLRKFDDKGRITIEYANYLAEAPLPSFNIINSTFPTAGVQRFKEYDPATHEESFMKTGQWREINNK